ncbi:MAG: GTPase HflX [Oscillospiraceae bacterium]|nr:GTPase HflX [Oscillospiraceae bacterium]
MAIKKALSELFENEGQVLRKAVLVAVDTGEYDVDVSLAELTELASTADIESVAEVAQKRGRLDRAFAIGRGKLHEVALFCHNTGADLVLFDQELSALQLRNIEEVCEVGVMDRTMLILEIFSRRARSHEGRLQVELARSRYLLPRLTGMGVELSRLGGGGGGAGAGARRGKGETMLELNRRTIREKISGLESQLEDLAERRSRTRQRRKKEGVLSAAIVGYTNVGKSTLLNALTGAGVLAEDKLFATLDPTARALVLPDGRKVLLIDTVGLVRRLPHHLVKAFHSTLEEAIHADLILNVCDISSPEAKDQIQVTRDLLTELKLGDTPILNVLNKADNLAEPISPLGEQTAVISAKTGDGFDELLRKVAALLPDGSRRLRLLIPYDQGGLVAEIREQGKIYAEEFVAQGTLLDALVGPKILHKVEAHIQP